MTHDLRNDGAREHTVVSDLLPWYANDSIDEHERERVDAHLALCDACRLDLAHEQRVYRGMNSGTAIEYMPAASLKRLQAQVDAAGAGTSMSDPSPTVPSTAESAAPLVVRSRRAVPWQAVMAASIAVMAVALSFLATDQWLQFRARSAQPGYTTVTAPIARAPGEVIRAVFSPAITLVELQAILNEAQVRIVAGPSEAGVYSLAANSRRPIGSSLALLRAHAVVRFAESTQWSSSPGDVP